MKHALVVSNLGKAYKRYPNRWARLAEWLLPGNKLYHHQHWVLQDINFTVEPGESIGIIGINGAGKSTLLKMITGTTQPTTGSVQITGRVAALLELGMGFHPDFTGRQNAFMAGQLLGYSIEEIAALMPETEAFAGVGDYIDQPVRMYSSGMQVRLAFAVSTAARPDVLIVDEALSVGDAAFQRKCFQRIEGFRTAGSTLLFVSHDIETVKKLCDRVLFIKEGRLAQWGPAKQVCDGYERYLFGDHTSSSSDNKLSDLSPGVEVASLDPYLVASCSVTYGNDQAIISNVRIEDTNGDCINVIQTGRDFSFIFEVQVNSDTITAPWLNMQIKTIEGVVIFGINTRHLNIDIGELSQGCRYSVSFKLENRLAPGVYFFTCGIKDGEHSKSFCSRVIDGVILKINDRNPSTVTRGVVDMRARFNYTGIGIS